MKWLGLYEMISLICLVFLYIYFIYSGRIHSAVISGLNKESRSVTVEWYEKGETKGKEVSFCSIVYQELSSLGY